jgi:branched-chain amino acid aminotransferase
MLFLDASGQISKEAPSISFLDHGFLFGDSIYEVIRVYEGKFFGWNEHFERLEKSAESLSMNISSALPTLRQNAEKLARAFGKRNSVIRMIITRGVGALHIDPGSCTKPTVVMAVWEYQSSYRPPAIRVMIPKVRRNHLRSMSPAIKSGNYLNNVMAFSEAKNAGFDDALFLNLSNELAELTTSNIGWISKGEIYTPALEVGILKGVTREFLLRTGRKVHEVQWCDRQISEMDEIFALSTLKEIVPIREVLLESGETIRFEKFDQSLALQESLRHTIEDYLSRENEVVGA